MKLESKAIVSKYFLEIIGLLLLVTYYNHGFFYRSFLTWETKMAMYYLVGFYGIVILPYNFLVLKDSTAFFKFPEIFKYSKRIIILLKSRKSIREEFIIIKNEEETKVFLFFIIKIIFIPIMLNYFIMYSKQMILFFIGGDVSWNYLLNSYQWFFFLSMVVVIVDTAYFSFGYIVEHSKLNNKVKSIDQSVLGWVATLSCYLPFNAVTNQLFPFYPNEELFWISPKLTNVLYITIIIFYFLYLWSTINLGAKCSNLTNRGIVTKGIYKVVRHPAYSSKVISWWLMSIPIMDTKVVVSMTAWTVIYIIRAYTEEYHLIKDVDYQSYRQHVRWQFVPFIK